MPSWLQDILRLAALVTAYLASQSGPAPQFMQVGPAYGSRILVPSNQLLAPAGQRIEFPQRPVDLAAAQDGNLIGVLMPGGVRLYNPAGQLLRTLPGTAASFLGLAFSPDGETVAASQSGGIAVGAVGGTPPPAIITVDSLPAGLAFDPGGAQLYVALNRSNEVARVDLAGRRVVAEVEVGVAPLGLAVTPDGARLFVTNWGGRRAAPGDTTAPSAGTPALIDSRGIASSGTVSVIDLASFKPVAEIAVGLHPSGIQISPDGALAAVANANSDSVSFLDTASLQVIATVEIPAWPRGWTGSSPTALAFSRDGQFLYVACGGINALAVLAREGAGFPLRGFVPTDWYPVAVAAAGDAVWVANSKGIGARNATRNFRVGQALGTINILSAAELTGASPEAVAAHNDPFAGASQPSDSPADLGRLGIRHVFLIIKENRTYDQVLGDLGRGNGDPALTTYGWNVSPNQHELASQFVLLDNYYASGVVSADGHQWLTQAMASDYVERAHAAWPRSYPYRGDDPLAFASTGFIWGLAQAHGLTARVYGEFTVAQGAYSNNWNEYLQDAQSGRMRIALASRSPVAALNPYVETSFPAFDLNVPDIYRAQVFLRKFREHVTRGDLPNLSIIQLPTDHTVGRLPLAPSPEAMVADNDLATGQIVEAISRSPYWPTSAIFITEDDAQDGADHVDGHRTLCLVASPYARRGAVDSTSYNQTSILRTIEEMLGLTPMNKFDAAALPMRSAFTVAADARPFPAVSNRVRLDSLNPPLAGLAGAQKRAALESLAMDFSQPDAAPQEKLNRILWHAAKGFRAHYPRVPHHPGCQVD